MFPPPLNILDADILVKRVEEKGEKNIKDARKGERTAKIEGLREVGYEKIGGRCMMERGKMKDGEGQEERWRGGSR